MKTPPRWLRAPLVVVASVFLVFEEIFWDDLERLAAWFGRVFHLARLERWVGGLNRWILLGLFLVPALALLPVKATGLWLVGSGRPVAGATLLVTAKLASTAWTARLFVLGRRQLLSFGAFAAAHAWIVGWRARMRTWLGMQGQLAGWFRGALRIARRRRAS